MATEGTSDMPSKRNPWPELIDTILSPLLEMGVSVDFWERQLPTPFAEQGEIVAKHVVAGGHFDTELGTSLREKFASVPDILGNLERKLIQADEATERGDQKLSLELWSEALEAAPWPAVQLELGEFLLLRSRIDPAPITERYFEWDDIGQEPIRPMFPDFAVPGPEAPNKREIQRLALEAYGRVYAYHLREAARSSKESPMDLGDAWRQYLVLDGLRVLFAEMVRWDLVETTCLVYSVWYSQFGWKIRSDDPYDPFGPRFAEAEGFIKGRQVELTVQQAVEEARRKVIVSDPDAFANKVADTVSERLGPIPLTTRAQLETELKGTLGGTWISFADSVKQSLIEADWWKQLLDAVDGRDYGPVVIEYARAVEGFLRQLRGSTEFNLSNLREMFKNHPRVKIGFLRSSVPMEELSEKIDRLTDARNKAAHGDPVAYRPTTRSRAEELRSLVVGSHEPGLLALLNKSRKP
jgi:hypothetical protein